MGAYPCQFYAAKGLKLRLNGRLQPCKWLDGVLKTAGDGRNRRQVARRGRLPHVPAVEQIRANEWIEIAVQDLLDVSAFDLGAVIFDQLIRLHCV